MCFTPRIPKTFRLLSVHYTINVRYFLYPSSSFAMLQEHDLIERPMKVVGYECCLLVNLFNGVPHDPYRGRGAPPFPSVAIESSRDAFSLSSRFASSEVPWLIRLYNS